MKDEKAIRNKVISVKEFCIFLFNIGTQCIRYSSQKLKYALL